MNVDAAFISCSVTKLDDKRRLKTPRSLSSPPKSTIVERNGKQFLVEFKERTERRYVRCVNKITGQVRLFEVTDRTPCRVIRRYKHELQHPPQKNISQNALPPIRQSDRRPVLPSISDSQSQTSETSSSSSTSDSRSETTETSSSTTSDSRSKTNRISFSSNPTYIRSLYGRNSRADGYSSRYNEMNIPVTSNIRENIYYARSTRQSSPQPPSIPQSTTKRAIDSAYDRTRYSRPSSLRSSSVGSKNAHSGYTSRPKVQPPLLLAPNLNVTAETVASEDTDDIVRANIRSSDSEQASLSWFDDQKTSSVFGGTKGRDSGSTVLDPFARSANPSDHHYIKQSSVNKYNEPIMNHPRFQQSAHLDYTPIPKAIRQTNQSEYSHHNNLNPKHYYA